MKSKKRISRSIIGFLLLSLAACFVTYKTLYDAGELGAVFHHPLPGCLSYTNITGAEDITTVDDGRVALISATDRQDLGTQKTVPGLYIYKGDGEPRLITPIEGEPHGITSTPSEMGSRVYVVVHKAGADDQVQIFDWTSADASLKLVRSVKFPDVRTLNGITALEGDRFFVSQDLGFPPGPFQEAEKALRLPLGKLWYFDGKSEGPRVIRNDILYPNGIAISADEKNLYLASMTGRSLIVYDLIFDDAGQASLKWRREWGLKTAPDNLKWAGDRLLIGSHRQLLTLLLHSFDGKRYRAPSQLISVKSLPDAAVIEELHATRSGGLEGISTGVLLKDQSRIVMGGIWSPGILDCDGTRSFPLPAPIPEIPAEDLGGRQPAPEGSP